MILAYVLLSLLLLLPYQAKAAADFDGVDDGAMGTALSNYFTTSAKTLIVRFRPTAAPGTPGGTCHTATNIGVVGGATETLRIIIALKSTTDLCGSHWDGTTDNINVVTGGVVNNNMHVALVHGGGNLLVYYSGVQQGSAIASGNTDALTQSFAVALTGIIHYAGRIDHVATYNVALSAEEIKVLFSSRKLRLQRTKPTGEWSFDNCAMGTTATNPFRDISFNNRTLTVAGGPICRGQVQLSYPGGIQ